MKSVKTLTSMKEIKAFSDPYRMMIMNQYYKLARPATVKQIADEMGEVPAKVHYHVKKLESVGILKLKHTKEINGIIAKFYEPTAQTFKVFNQDIGDISYNNQFSGDDGEIIEIFETTQKLFLERCNDRYCNNEAILLMEDILLTPEEYEEIFVELNRKVNELRARSENSEGPRYRFMAAVVANE